MKFLYTIVDVQTGREFWNENDYEAAVKAFFTILDYVYHGEDNGYLHLRNNETGRAVSVVL